jgi:hypothetical protein
VIATVVAPPDAQVPVPVNATFILHRLNALTFEFVGKRIIMANPEVVKVPELLTKKFLAVPLETVLL